MKKLHVRSYQQAMAPIPDRASASARADRNTNADGSADGDGDGDAILRTDGRILLVVLAALLLLCITVVRLRCRTFFEVFRPIVIQHGQIITWIVSHDRWR